MCIRPPTQNLGAVLPLSSYLTLSATIPNVLRDSEATAELLANGEVAFRSQTNIDSFVSFLAVQEEQV